MFCLRLNVGESKSDSEYAFMEAAAFLNRNNLRFPSCFYPNEMWLGNSKSLFIKMELCNRRETNYQLL